MICQIYGNNKLHEKLCRQLADTGVTRKGAHMEQEKQPYVRTKAAAVGYGNNKIVENIELTLNRGQIMTLIGPNGAGKSTILKTFTRQLPLVAGNIVLDGCPLERYPAAELAKKIAMVMTERLRTELMTCWEVVATGRYPYTGKMGILSKEDKEKVQQSLAMVQAQTLADLPFESISDGQRQRIMLARAICQEPELLILDEPTSYLDIRHKLELLFLLKNLVREKNVAVLMSLHELDLAQKISDSVVCVRNGKIDRQGTPEEVFTSSYIKELYGITRGSYHASLGFLELEPVRDKPEIFVIGGGGRGIPVYHRLQREGLAFYAGILHENDIEYPVAEALAAEVVGERAFEPTSEKQKEKAWQLLRTCRQVICPVMDFGTQNTENYQLLQLAKRAGIPICNE